MQINITINGKKELSPTCTLSELVDRLGLPSESLVIELNHAIIKQNMWQGTWLKEDDQLELLNFVGGG